MSWLVVPWLYKWGGPLLVWGLARAVALVGFTARGWDLPGSLLLVGLALLFSGIGVAMEWQIAQVPRGSEIDRELREAKL